MAADVPPDHESLEVPHARIRHRRVRPHRLPRRRRAARGGPRGRRPRPLRRVGRRRSRRPAPRCGAATSMTSTGWRRPRREADGVIHLAFKHDLMATGDMEAAIAADMAATQAFGDALAGTDKPFVNTSGTLMLAMMGLGRTGTEDDRSPGGHRADVENATLALADRGVRSSVIRLSPLVHSRSRQARLRPDPDRHRPREGLRRLPRRRRQPLAGGPHPRRRAPLPPRGRVGARPARSSTASATKASRSARSPRRSAAAPASRPARSPRPRSPTTSASSPASSPSTTRPRTRRPARSSAGSRPTPA